MNYIPLSNKGGSKITIPLVDSLITFRTCYNYSAECWVLDLLDTAGEVLLAGLMLVPNVDIMHPYPSLQEEIGSLVLVEKNEDDYKDAELLGSTTKLLWFAPGEEIELP